MAKICLVSSSGGHYEQLNRLKPLGEKHEIFFVTEKTGFKTKADYYLKQTGSKDWLFPIKMMLNVVGSVKIWFKEKPDYVITTGTMVALPLCLIAKLLKKKVVYIETFARVYDGTKAGKLMYKYADLFIYQWEYLKEIYPEGIYGGSIY